MQCKYFKRTFIRENVSRPVPANECMNSDRYTLTNDGSRRCIFERNQQKCILFEVAEQRDI